MLHDTLPVGLITEVKTSAPVLSPDGEVVPLSAGLWKRGPCFSCGQQGHGVNRCSRMDVSFPFILPGWSVDVRNGQYRASRTRGDGRDSAPGKGGWFGQEDQPPGPSMIVTHLTPEGGSEYGGGGGALVGLVIVGGGYPQSSMDPECPGLSSFGEPHSC